MIDTVKIFTFINKQTYKKVKYCSDVKCMYNNSDGKLYYEITSTSLQGTYDNRFHVRVDEASRYGLDGYVLEAERQLS